MSVLETARLRMVLVGFVSLQVAVTDGDDRIWLQPQQPTASQSDWYPRAITSVVGDVNHFDATELRIKIDDHDSETRIAAARVLWIEPGAISALESEAIQLFDAGDYAKSLSKLPSVLQQRPPVWRQQWITMLASVAAWKSGRGKIALELVSQLDQRPLPPLVLAWLPVAWQNGVQRAEAVTAAQNRLIDKSPAAQLVAASWLLSSPERAEAVEVLRKLQAHDRALIAKSAEVLLWRIATPPQVMESARKWHQALDSMPMVMQMGPTRTLIDKQRAAGLSEAANRLRWSLELTPIHPHPAARVP